MPRKVRTEAMRKREAHWRKLLEESLSELEPILRREFRNQQADDSSDKNRDDG